MTFEIGVGAFTICAAVLVFGLLASAPFKTAQTSHRTGNSVSALDVNSARVAPPIEPTPSASPTPAPGAPVLPDTSNANPRPSTLAPSSPAATAHPTSKPTSNPTKPPPIPVTDNAPVVILLVTPAGAPLTVSADASQSNDRDATPIANFVFNFGDGTTITPVFGGSVATHQYVRAGTYTITVVATDTAGHSSSASMMFTVL